MDATALDFSDGTFSAVVDKGLLDSVIYFGRHFRAKREHFEVFNILLPKIQGRNLAVTVLCVPYSLDSGVGRHNF